MTTEENYDSVSIKHKEVLNHIADGMAKYKAWQKVYPECKSMQAALQSVKRIMNNPTAVLYMSEIRQERDRYINEKNGMSIDRDCQIYMQSISRLQAAIQTASINDDFKAIAALENQLTNKQQAIEKLTGLGSYNPMLKLHNKDIDPQRIPANNDNNNKIDSSSQNTSNNGQSDIDKANESNIESFIDIIATPIKSDA